MKSDKELLETPLKDLSKEERARAFLAYDRKATKIDEENKKYKSRPIGRVHVIGDSIEALNPADGKVYSSKSKYYQALKDTGNHVVEPGEQGKKLGLQGDYNLRPELKQAMQQHLGR